MLSFKKGYPLENINSENWSSHEWLHFLRKLPKDISLNNLKKLDLAFNFTNSGNAEILNAWFQLIIPTNYKAEVLTTNGKDKIILNLFARSSTVV